MNASEMIPKASIDRLNRIKIVSRILRVSWRVCAIILSATCCMALNFKESVWAGGTVMFIHL